MKLIKNAADLFSLFFSEGTKDKIANLVFVIAVIFFVVHSLIIAMVGLGIIPGSLYERSGNTPDPLSAIYTPFSIILLYEVYLIIYYLPRSITIYLGKQYEIIALILLRNIFDDLSKLSVKINDEPYEPVVNLLWTIGGLILLLLLLACFYKLSAYKHVRIAIYECSAKQKRFIAVKKVLAFLLLVLFVILFFSTLLKFKNFYPFYIDNIITMIKEMSNLFFSTFFTVLIIIEVLLLLFMYDLDEKFSKVVRNSGFIVSTILLKLSFRVEDKANLILILIAVTFGVIILGINKLYEHIEQ